MSASRVASSAVSALRSQRKNASPERLQDTLRWLNKEPRPVLSNIRALSLTYAIRDAHFGARHFAKEDLPRISYVNQNLQVFVDRKHPDIEKEPIEPLISIEFENGSVKNLDMANKTSSTILQELLTLDRSV